MKLPLIRRSTPLFLVVAASLALAGPLALADPGPLNDADEKFMTLYEQVLKGLVTDNLPAAQQAASSMGDAAGADVAKAKDLKEARKAFGDLSAKAEKMVAGRPGFRVYNCPMVNKDWVQHDTASAGAPNTIANPYLGKDMLTCGVEKK